MKFYYLFLNTPTIARFYLIFLFLGNMLFSLDKYGTSYQKVIPKKDNSIAIYPLKYYIISNIQVRNETLYWNSSNMHLKQQFLLKNLLKLLLWYFYRLYTHLLSHICTFFGYLCNNILHHILIKGMVIIDLTFDLIEALGYSFSVL